MVMPAIVEVWQVGAHFKALVNGVLMAPSDLRCLFLRPKRDLLNNVFRECYVESIAFKSDHDYSNLKENSFHLCISYKDTYCCQ